MRALSIPDNGRLVGTTSTIEIQSLESKLIEQSLLIAELSAENENLRSKVSRKCIAYDFDMTISPSGGTETMTEAVDGLRMNLESALARCRSLEQTIHTLKHKSAHREAKHMITLKQMRHQVETLEGGRRRQSKAVNSLERQVEYLTLVVLKSKDARIRHLERRVRKATGQIDLDGSSQTFLPEGSDNSTPDDSRDDSTSQGNSANTSRVYPKKRESKRRTLSTLATIPESSQDTGRSK